MFFARPGSRKLLGELICCSVYCMSSCAIGGCSGVWHAAGTAESASVLPNFLFFPMSLLNQSPSVLQFPSGLFLHCLSPTISFFPVIAFAMPFLSCHYSLSSCPYLILSNAFCLLYASKSGPRLEVGSMPRNPVDSVMKLVETGIYASDMRRNSFRQVSKTWPNMFRKGSRSFRTQSKLVSEKIKKFQQTSLDTQKKLQVSWNSRWTTKQVESSTLNQYTAH